MNNVTPTRKVGTGAVAGALAAIGWWAAESLYGISAPAEIVASSVTVMTFCVQWLVPDRRV